MNNAQRWFVIISCLILMTIVEIFVIVHNIDPEPPLTPEQVKLKIYKDCIGWGNDTKEEEKIRDKCYTITYEQSK